MLAVVLFHVAALHAIPYDLPERARNAEFYDVVRQLLELNSGLQEQVGRKKREKLTAGCCCCCLISESRAQHTYLHIIYVCTMYLPMFLKFLGFCGIKNWR